MRAHAETAALDARIPRAGGLDRLGDDPMAYLDVWRKRLGDVYVLEMQGPLLSRDEGCTGVVAVFGEAQHRAVLGDIERFVLPVSAAKHYGLPPALINLNAGLHGMHGARHAREKTLLARAMAEADAACVGMAVEAAIRGMRATLSGDSGWPLLATMRLLTLRASTALLFGESVVDGFAPDALMAYFQLRREATMPWATMDAVTRQTLVRSGCAVDAGLRRYRAAVRAGPRDAAAFGMLAALAGDDALDEEAFVAHANVLFISSNEPVAAALTWTLLALSQLPGLRARLREEALRAGSADADGRSFPVAPLADSVINESLRVLTPNALMARVTREPVRLAGYRLLAGCEVMVCPFLSHREPARFPQPRRFMPSRWSGLRPSPYEYFPFGAGGHVCAGRGFALRLLRECLAALMRCGEAVLDGDAELDWRIHVVLLPVPDPRMRLLAQGADACGGALRGGVAGIVEFVEEKG